MKLRIASLVRICLLSLVVLGSLLVIRFERTHYRKYGHLVFYGVHVDSLSEDYDIGIPGQTKLYYAQLSNYTLWPVSLPACDYVTDAFEKGTEFPYAVQRWDATSKSWPTVVDMSGKGFCRPAPLSTIEDHIVTKKLWPFSSVRVMDGEATGAREPFRKGDLARFVVFRKLNQSGDWQSAIPSVPFQIMDDVERNENGPLRVKH